MRLPVLTLITLAACAGQPSQTDGGEPQIEDAGTVMTATMSLFETSTPDGGVRFESFVEISPLSARYDGGCELGPKPSDADGAWLRISGYAAAGQPLVCMNEDGGYVCRFPSGVEASVVYDAGTEPLGTGPILFAVAGGADVGSTAVSVTPPAGTLSASVEGKVLHLTCSDDCSAARVLVLSATLRCDLAYAPTLTLPVAPTAFSVVRATSAQTGDHRQAVLVGRVGRGVSLP
ncbi:MAG: hypothetical protein IPJ65_28650 [Archangiaceae bacterium]|nr:hypothetical protein [Archangiaceae bacterium]